MPSFGVHLAIANKYLEKNNDNKEEFIKGTISIDLAEDKEKSHFADTTLPKTDLKKFISGRVILKDYIKENSINNSYERGGFLHILTDYYFYTSFFDDIDLNFTSYEVFKTTLYNDYALVNEHLKERYSIEFIEEIKNFDLTKEGSPILLKIDILDEFIDRMSNLNLDDLYNEYK